MLVLRRFAGECVDLVFQCVSEVYWSLFCLVKFIA